MLCDEIYDDDDANSSGCGDDLIFFDDRNFHNNTNNDVSSRATVVDELSKDLKIIYQICKNINPRRFHFDNFEDYLLNGDNDHDSIFVDDDEDLTSIIQIPIELDNEPMTFFNLPVFILEQDNSIPSVFSNEVFANDNDETEITKHNIIAFPDDNFQKFSRDLINKHNLNCKEFISEKFQNRNMYICFENRITMGGKFYDNYVFDLKNYMFIKPSRCILSLEYNFTSNPLSILTRYSFDNMKDLMAEFSEFINKLFPNISVREFFMDSLMACLVGGCFGRSLFLLFGDTRNGKSTIINLLKLVFCFVIQSKGSDGKTQLSTTHAECFGEERIMIMSEHVWDNNEKSVAWLKAVSGNDDVISRPPYGGVQLEVTPRCIPFIASNDLPAYKPSNQALADRCRYIPLDSEFVDDLEATERKKRKRPQTTDKQNIVTNGESNDNNIPCKIKKYFHSKKKKHIFEAKKNFNMREYSSLFMLLLCARYKSLDMSLDKINSIKYSSVPDVCLRAKWLAEREQDSLYHFIVRHITKDKRRFVSLSEFIESFSQFVCRNLKKFPDYYKINDISKLSNEEEYSNPFDAIEDTLFARRMLQHFKYMEITFDVSLSKLLGHGVNNFENLEMNSEI